MPVCVNADIDPSPQTPTQQTGRLDYNKCSGLIAPGGGFGPVTKDGYGVSYIIPGDFVIFFHVSSFNSSPDTVGDMTYELCSSVASPAFP